MKVLLVGETEDMVEGLQPKITGLQSEGAAGCPGVQAVARCQSYQLHLVGQMHFCLKKAILASGLLLPSWIVVI